MEVQLFHCPKRVPLAILTAPRRSQDFLGEEFFTGDIWSFLPGRSVAYKLELLRLNNAYFGVQQPLILGDLAFQVGLVGA